MAITKGAKRAIGVAKRRHIFNLRRKDSLKSALKEVTRFIKAGKKKEAEVSLSKVYKQLDKSAKTHLIKKGNASRKKSRLAKQIAKLN